MLSLSGSILICKLLLTTMLCCNKEIYWKARGSSQNRKEAVWEKGRSQGCHGSSSKSDCLLITPGTGLAWELLCHPDASGMALPTLLPALYQEWVKDISDPLGFHNGRWQWKAGTGICPLAKITYNGKFYR